MHKSVISSSRRPRKSSPRARLRIRSSPSARCTSVASSEPANLRRKSRRWPRNQSSSLPISFFSKTTQSSWQRAAASRLARPSSSATRSGLSEAQSPLLAIAVLALFPTALNTCFRKRYFLQTIFLLQFLFLISLTFRLRNTRCSRPTSSSLQRSL